MERRTLPTPRTDLSPHVQQRPRREIAHLRVARSQPAPLRGGVVRSSYGRVDGLPESFLGRVAGRAVRDALRSRRLPHRIIVTRFRGRVPPRVIGRVAPSRCLGLLPRSLQSRLKFSSVRLLYFS